MKDFPVFLTHKPLVILKKFHYFEKLKVIFCSLYIVCGGKYRKFSNTGDKVALTKICKMKCDKTIKQNFSEVKF